MISINNLSVTYRSAGGSYVALENINVDLNSGETCAIIGPSGCGKSTLLKVLAGIITDFAGRVTIDGQPLAPRKQRIGFIPQNYGLLPWKNVYENICLGVKIKNRHRRGDKEDLSLLLAQLGLEGLEHRYPRELSGGQQQRVALARAFLLAPDLLLMDEPFSALDAITREDMQNVFLRVWREHAVSTVLVTHQVEEAVYLGHKIIILSPSPGTITAVLDNPLFGSEDARDRQDFFQICRALRQKIKKDWSR